MAVQFADFCYCTKKSKNVSEIGLTHYKPSHQIGSSSIYGNIAVLVDIANCRPSIVRISSSLNRLASDIIGSVHNYDLLRFTNEILISLHS